MRLAAIITGARSAAADPVMPSPGRIRGVRVISSIARPVRRAQDELVGVLVVEVDEARGPLRGRPRRGERSAR